MSVFSKPYEELAKKVKVQTRFKDNALYWHFMARVFESWCSRMKVEGDADPRMLRRMPEYQFCLGSFGMFNRDGLHAWELGGTGGIDEYGFPLSYILNSANGKVVEGEPVPPPSERVVLPPEEVVVFRANHIGLSPIQIISPIIDRLVQSIRTIDNVTKKRGTSLFYTPDSPAKAALDTVLSKLGEPDCDLALSFKLPDLDGIIKELSLFGDSGPALADLWESSRQFASEMWETVGENSVSFEKKERLIVPEVEANDGRRINSIFGVAYAEMKAGLELANKKFGSNLHMVEPEPKPEPEPVPDPEQEEGDDNEER